MLFLITFWIVFMNVALCVHGLHQSKLHHINKFGPQNLKPNFALDLLSLAETKNISASPNVTMYNYRDMYYCINITCGKIFIILKNK